MSDLTERIDGFIIKYHVLHDVKYKKPEQAQAQLRKLGAKRIKTLLREHGKTYVYEHPKFGTFTVIADKKGKTQIAHYPMPKQEVRDAQMKGRVYLQPGEKVPKGKKFQVGKRGGRFYLV